MAITFIGSAVEAVDSLTSPQTASAFPTGYTTDDLLIAQIVSREDSPTPAHAITTSGASWTQIGTTAFLDLGSAGIANSVWYRFATSASETMPSVACPTPAQLGCTISCFRGVDKTTPLDGVTVQEGTASASTTLQVRPAGATMTPTTAYAWILAVACSADDNTLSMSTANGFTSRWTFNHTAGTDAAAIGASQEVATPAAKSGPTFTQTVLGSDAWAWHTFVLKPRADAVPDQVGTVTPTAGVGQVGLSWSAPFSQPAIDDYKVEYKLTSEPTTWTDWTHTGTATTNTVTGLTAGLSYDFRVSAHNSVGYGAVSATAQATPVALSATADFISASGVFEPTAQLGTALTATADHVSASGVFEPTAQLGTTLTATADFIAASSVSEPTAAITVNVDLEFVSASGVFEPTASLGTALTATADFVSASGVFEPTAQLGTALTATADHVSASGVFEPTAYVEPAGIPVDFIPAGPVYEPTATLGEALTATLEFIAASGISEPQTATLGTPLTATLDFVSPSATVEPEAQLGISHPIVADHVSASGTFEPAAVLGEALQILLDFVGAGVVAEPTLLLGVPLAIALDHLAASGVFEPLADNSGATVLEFIAASGTFEPTAGYGVHVDTPIFRGRLNRRVFSGRIDRTVTGSPAPARTLTGEHPHY